MLGSFNSIGYWSDWLDVLKIKLKSTLDKKGMKSTSGLYSSFCHFLLNKSSNFRDCIRDRTLIESAP